MKTSFILRRRKLGRTSCKEIAARSKTGITVIRNDAPLPVADVVFRWGTTSNVPKKDGQLVINSAESIHWCADKKQGRLDMQNFGVPVPETWTAEYVFGPESPFGPGFGGEFVLRRAKHAQGKDLWHGDWKAIIDAIRLHDVYDGYVSRKIDKIAEFRVYVVNGKVVAVAQKTPGNPQDVAWNVAQGGRFDNVRWGDWNLKVCQAAILAALVSKTDFCGVDVMLDKDGNPFVLEVNSAPSMTSDYRQTVFAKAFDYIVNNGNGYMESLKNKSWRDYAHPAILPAE